MGRRVLHSFDHVYRQHPFAIEWLVWLFQYLVIVLGRTFILVKDNSPHYSFSDGAFLQEVAHLGKHVRHGGDILGEL
jgi:hypothetical protein